MGSEQKCRVRYAGKIVEGKALLETKELLFRGELRLAIPLSDVKSVRAGAGELTVVFGEQEATFELGPVAEKWAKKIASPPSRLDKLGVKPGMRVVVLGIADADFHAELGQRTAILTAIQPECDLIFLGALHRRVLAELVSLQRSLKPNGALWVVRPKGHADISEADVLWEGKAAGLTDTKVVAFSPTHTAAKFVIPVARRGSMGASALPRS